MSSNYQSQKEPNLIIRLSCLYVGAAQLLPWNALLCSINYWLLAFSDDPTKTQNEIAKYKSIKTINFYQKFWTSFLGLTAQLSTILLLFFTKFFTIFNKLSDDLKIRIAHLTFLTSFIIFFACPLMSSSSGYENENDPAIYFSIAIFATILCCGASAWNMSISCSVLNRVDFTCFNLMSSGQALGGLVVTMLVIFSSLIFKSEVKIESEVGNMTNIENIKIIRSVRRWPTLSRRLKA